MNILLATYWSVPHLGGVWNYMVQLKERLELLGHTVDMLGYDEINHSVYIVNEDRKIDREKLLPLLDSNLEIGTYPEIHANLLVRFTEYQRYVYELSATYLGLDKYDVIHAQDVLAASCISRVKPKNVALVSTLHGSVAHSIYHQLTTIHKSDNSFIAKEYFDVIENIGATCGDETIVANQWLKNILVNDFHVPSDCINVLHYGFDSENFIRKTEQKSNFVRPVNKKVILYAGRLVELKGVQNLIKAMKSLKKDPCDWVCWIAGDGNYKSTLEALCQDLGLQEDFFFFGRSDDVPSLLKLADIFVYPSLQDNQPLSVIEAQIAGKAIVVSDAGGIPEIVEDGVTGLMYPANNVEELTKKIQTLLNDDNYMKLLGHNARNWGLTYWSIDEGVKKLVNIYESALSKLKLEKKGVKKLVNLYITALSKRKLDKIETTQIISPLSSTIQQFVEPEVRKILESKLPKDFLIPNPILNEKLKNLYRETYSDTFSLPYNESQNMATTETTTTISNGISDETSIGISNGTSSMTFNQILNNLNETPENSNSVNTSQTTIEIHNNSKNVSFNQDISNSNTVPNEITFSQSDSSTIDSLEVSDLNSFYPADDTTIWGPSANDYYLDD